MKMMFAWLMLAITTQAYGVEQWHVSCTVEDGEDGSYVSSYVTSADLGRYKITFSYFDDTECQTLLTESTVSGDYLEVPAESGIDLVIENFDVTFWDETTVYWLNQMEYCEVTIVVGEPLTYETCPQLFQPGDDDEYCPAREPGETFYQSIWYNANRTQLWFGMPEKPNCGTTPDTRPTTRDEDYVYERLRTSEARRTARVPAMFHHLIHPSQP